MSSTAITSAQSQKEIAVMLPAAGDPYFKLKACGYTEAGKQAGYDVKIYDAFADPGRHSAKGQRHRARASKL
jgi:ABC-type sugar transport system substrate-binding protein